MNDLERMRHSCAHVMAEAVVSLFPEAKLAIGPPIDDGFYYDFDLPRPLTTDDLAGIEARMRNIVAKDAPFLHSMMQRDEAVQFFTERKQPFKVEIIRGLPDELVGIYQQNDFIDLCKGPHVESTGKIGPFKLLNVAGAYWRGDEHQPMLQRIYGTAWPTQVELDEYLNRLAEAAKRDHRKLGRELDLFSFHEESPGSVFWLPNGTILRQVIEDFIRAEQRKRGYKEVRTPVMLDRTLWERSGHWNLYKNNMFVTETEEHEFGIKPMNCIGAYTIYKEKLHSFRELPLRLAETTGVLHRNELSGTLNGLFRVRQFVQDDTHIFVAPEEVDAELGRVVDFGLFILRAFGFDEFKVGLSVRDPANTEKFLGADEQWNQAEDALRRIAAEHGLEPEIMFGEAKFYGPSLDIHVRDALGRYWQCTTVQVDFNAPERFDLEYIGSDGQAHRPVVIHRALIGSFERFIGVLVEHYAGAFPVWLAPVQARLIPIADRHLPYAESVAEKLRDAGLRVDVDDRREKVNYKIRQAQLEKVPYMLVVGDKEIEADAVSVRLRTGENLGPIPWNDFAALARRVIETRSADLTVGEPTGAAG